MLHLQKWLQVNLLDMLERSQSKLHVLSDEKAVTLLIPSRKVFVSKGSKDHGSMERSHIQGNYICCRSRAELSNTRTYQGDKIARYQFHYEILTTGKSQCSSI